MVSAQNLRLRVDLSAIFFEEIRGLSPFSRCSWPACSRQLSEPRPGKWPWFACVCPGPFLRISKERTVDSPARASAVASADKPPTKMLTKINDLIRARIKAVELLGVLMRITSFTLVSWLGPKSPFLFVWVFNTSDAVILSWCSILKKDRAYTLLNVFWILIGVTGIFRAVGFTP